MFLSTSDFKQLASEAEPTQVVEFINSTITIYDRVVETYDNVIKVIIFKCVYNTKIKYNNI